MAIAIKREVAHKRLNIITTLQAVALEVQPMGKGKRTLCTIYLPPQENVTVEGMRELMDQLPTPMIVMGDFNADNNPTKRDSGNICRILQRNITKHTKETRNKKE